MSRFCAPLIVACLALALFAPLAPAQAGPQEAQRLQTQAALLLDNARISLDTALSAPALAPPDLSPAFVAGLQAFGLAASRLSLEIENAGGPQDMRCIFRGMAEETGAQLDAMMLAHTGADQAAALERIVSMLDDAKLVARAAALSLQAASETDAPATDITIGSCPAAYSND